MEIGVISDVHSNLPALEAVLEEFDNRGVDEIICAGDLIGYYPYPNDVLNLISSREIKCVRGNHDEAVLTGTPQNYKDTAIKTLKWTKNQIDEEKKDIIKSYPVERVEKYNFLTVHVVHGSPLHPFTDYIYPEDVDHRFIKENLNKSPDFLILGHTHEQFRVNIGETTVLNPGSVGQPRDGEKTAGYAIIDTEYESATLYRASYDIKRTKNKIQKEGLPQGLARRLTEGK